VLISEFTGSDFPKKVQKYGFSGGKCTISGGLFRLNLAGKVEISVADKQFRLGFQKGATDVSAGGRKFVSFLF
jgi:hypothetical protein